MGRRAWVLLGLIGLGGGCTKPKPVDVAPLAAEDQQLQKNETELAGRRTALQRERKKISDARAELAGKRKQLAATPAAQAALDEEEQKLLEKEGELGQLEQELNQKLDQLLRERGALVQRVTETVAAAPGADPLERAARREQGVASREKDVAERERAVASREKELAEREARQARREKETCGTAAVVAAPAELPKGLRYAAQDVEPVYKKALRAMQERGLLVADLPPGTQRLVDETREAMKKADFVRAKYDADTLLAAIEDIKIDRGFIATKMARLSAALKGTKLEGEPRKKMEALFQEATTHYGDGKFPQANQKINAIFAQLK